MRKNKQNIRSKSVGEMRETYFYPKARVLIFFILVPTRTRYGRSILKLMYKQPSTSAKVKSPWNSKDDK